MRHMESFPRCLLHRCRLLIGWEPPLAVNGLPKGNLAALEEEKKTEWEERRKKKSILSSHAPLGAKATSGILKDAWVDRIWLPEVERWQTLSRVEGSAEAWEGEPVLRDGWPAVVLNLSISRHHHRHYRKGGRGGGRWKGKGGETKKVVSEKRGGEGEKKVAEFRGVNDELLFIKWRETYSGTIQKTEQGESDLVLQSSQYLHSRRQPWNYTENGIVMSGPLKILVYSHYGTGKSLHPHIIPRKRREAGCVSTGTAARNERVGVSLMKRMFPPFLLWNIIHMSAIKCTVH